MSNFCKSIVFGLTIMGFSCVYDNAEELYDQKDCTDNDISFIQNIEPIISTNCAVSGCHINGGQIPTLTTYEQISSNAGLIKIRTSNGTMPPSNSGYNLTQEEIDDIACWVDAGAPSN